MQITTKSGLTLQLPSLEEDAQISAALDEESPELEESFFQRAVPAKDILGSDMVSWLNGKAPTPENTPPDRCAWTIHGVHPAFIGCH